MSFLGDIWNFIMAPLYFGISWVLVTFHKLWSLLFTPESGVSWVLSIVCLTLVVRASLIPLFVKQIRSSRNMQLLQPKMKELQTKYGHDRERLAQETMKMYKETGTNPFASCLPILIQMPIFFALFQIINKAATGAAISFMDKKKSVQFSAAEIFGAKISDAFTTADSTNVKILAAVLVIAMTATTFLTQRQLMSKNMPADALTGPYAQQQKMLLYVLPVVFAVGGIAFPIGVLIYWTTSNLWTMGQQYVVIRNSPAPNTEAARQKEIRDAAKAAKKKGTKIEASVVETAETEEEVKQVNRAQPKKQSRSQRKKS